MRKSVTKIVKATLAVAMMIGAGVGAATSSPKANPIYAVAEAGTFVKVTSSSLTVGDVVIFVNSAATFALGDLSKTSEGYGTTVSVSPDANGKITLTDSTTVTQFIVEAGASSGYAFKAKNNTNFNDYYLAYTSTATSSKNYLNRYSSNSAQNTQGQCTINYGTTMSVRSVYNNGRWLRFNSDRFAFYYHADTESTTGTGVNIYKKLVPATSLSITGNSATPLSPGQTRQLGSNVSPNGYTDVITWSSSDNSVATVSQAGLVTAVADGNAVITARANASVSDSVSIVVESPSNPFITPSKNSTSGYTTENEVISFAYGNLNNSLSVSSDDTTVATVNSPITDGSSGTVQINFVGAGTAYILFKDGSTQLASVEVTVTIEHGRIKTDPLSVEEALDIGDALEESEETTKDYYINGFVSPTIKNPTFSGTPAKTTFWLAKDESTSKGFECYKVTLADGLDSEDLKVGADVIVHCTIKKYNSTTIENGSVGEIVGLSFSSVPATSIEINKNSASLVVGGETSLTVKTLLPVYTTDVAVWSSSEENVATVDQTGTVIAVGTGTAIISATAGSISAECIVNVSDEIIDLSNKSYEYHKPASIENAVHTLTIGGYSMNLLNVYNQTTNTAQPPVTTTNNYLAFGSKDFTTANTLLSNKTPVPGAITKIVFHSRSGSSPNAVYKAIVSSTEVTSPVAGEVDSLTGIGTLTINVDASLNRRYFAISCVTTGYNGQLDSIEITYETTAETIENYSTRAMLSYGYSKLDENSYEFDDVAIRFGGLVSVEMWNRLNSESTIIGYGVMLSTTVHVNSNGGQLKALSINGSTVVGFEKSVPGDKEHPVLASAEQKGNLIGDYYIWNLYNNVPSGFLTTSLTAVTYIKTSSGNVYFKQVTTSVKGLAQDMIASDAYDEDSLDGSLNYLANLA